MKQIREHALGKKTKIKCIGILTAGGDCPGLNAAIRAVAKAAINHFDMRVIGILDGFRGLVENRSIPLDNQAVSGILTHGGTILGTSRDKPHKMKIDGKSRDMTATAAQNARRMGIECLVCLGGGGTQKNALQIQENGGLPVVTLPKTIDNDVAETDVTFGYDTALGIATEAIDRLHTTASSHHRMIVCELMGHNAGWLALGAGIAGGADVIMIPEIPYDLKCIAEHLLERRRAGKRFSIIALAEGAVARAAARQRVRGAGDDSDVAPAAEPLASRLARQLQQLANMEVRVTSLGHVQRGGTPSPADRLLCSQLGAKAAELISRGKFNVMVGIRGGASVAVPLEKVAGRIKQVPPDHDWIKTARRLGISLGDNAG